jgi:hypothetical protein
MPSLLNLPLPPSVSGSGHRTVSTIIALLATFYATSCLATGEHPISCLAEYSKLVKPVSSALVQPEQTGGPSWDIKNAFEYSGAIGPDCKKVFGETGSFRVITQNGKLFFLELRATTKEPVMVKYLPQAEISRMEAALRQGGAALANFKLAVDGGVVVTYSIRRWGADFLESVGFLAFEAKYK